MDWTNHAELLGVALDVNKAEAKEWLQRAAKHPDTKARADKALRQLGGE